MIVKYEYDQDPRYGWASIDVTETKNPLIIIHTDGGSKGYTLDENNDLILTCICHASNEDECACVGVNWE
jgi:hypothetical protein